MSRPEPMKVYVLFARDAWSGGWVVKSVYADDVDARQAGRELAKTERGVNWDVSVFEVIE